jgi:hypothetical protein
VKYGIFPHPAKLTEEPVKNRRSLTPSPIDPGGGVQATRRGGARREVSARVTLTPRSPTASSAALSLEGWALNVSHGGVRVILEDKVELGAQFDVTIVQGASAAEDRPSPRSGRIVWLQEEPDGVVAGIEFY